MDIFAYTDYKQFLNALIKTKARGFQASLAKALNCQGSYLIQVLTKKSELTEDQALKMTTFLEMTLDHRDYFMLLVNFSRASTPELRLFYTEKIEKLQTHHAEIKSRVPNFKEIDLKIAMEYFSSWDVSTIHLATSSHVFQKPEIISKRFSLRLERVNYVLKFLEENGLVEQNSGKWIYKGDPIYLSKESILNNIHQLNRREQVARSLRQQDLNDIHFGSVFAINKPLFDELKNDIKSLIEKSHQKIVSSPSEEIYSMVIDLFKLV